MKINHFTMRSSRRCSTWESSLFLLVKISGYRRWAYFHANSIKTSSYLQLNEVVSTSPSHNHQVIIVYKFPSVKVENMGNPLPALSVLIMKLMLYLITPEANVLRWWTNMMVRCNWWLEDMPTVDERFEGKKLSGTWMRCGYQGLIMCFVSACGNWKAQSNQITARTISSVNYHRHSWGSHPCLIQCCLEIHGKTCHMNHCSGCTMHHQYAHATLTCGCCSQRNSTIGWADKSFARANKQMGAGFCYIGY